jgi:GNAT superfamily N-acetyltransferase
LEPIQKLESFQLLESFQKIQELPSNVADSASGSVSAIVPPGIRTLIRPTSCADVERVRQFLTGLSAESSYRRFFTGLGRVPERFVRQLVEVDHERREALVVLAGEAVIALADYALLAGCPGSAELGVVVADGWQRRGLGQQLVGHLLAVAHTRGVTQLRAHTLAENIRVARMIRRRWPAARPERDEALLIWQLPLAEMRVGPAGAAGGPHGGAGTG